MAHSGFKGNLLGLRSMTLTNGAIACEFGFLDEEGTLHATTKLHIPVEPNEAIKKKVEELAEALIEYAVPLHFTNPGTAKQPGELETQRGGRGIAETMGDSFRTTDEPGGPEGSR